MASVIYVRGEGNALERVWQNAHPRRKRSGTTLHLFDYPDNAQRTWKRWDGKLPPAGGPDTETSIKSILDLYAFVKGRPSADIRELHFFTHGWEVGPVLHNTFEDASTPLNARDPNDDDPRIKDFSIPAVLDGAEGRKFATAFARTALIKLWGCTHREDFRQMIKRDFYRAPSNADRQAITTRYKQFIRDGTYQFALHKVTGVPVYAAPLGWGSNPYLPFGIQGPAAAKVRAKYRGVFPPAKGDQWWRVSQFFRPDRGRDFYVGELAATLDVLDYVAYTSKLVK